MKQIFKIAWMGMFLTAGAIYAGENGDRANREREPGVRDESFPERLERGGRSREPRPEIPPDAERWLAELKERNPKQYRDFMRLKERKPERFLDELHQAMQAHGERPGNRGGGDGVGNGEEERPRGGPGSPGLGGSEGFPQGPRGKVVPGSGPRPPHVEALETWLRGLKERNPDEYQRLMRLREENPELFRQEVRSQLERIREERRRQNGGGREGSPQPDDAAREEFEQKMRKSVQAWKSAGSEEDRARIEQEIREQIRIGLHRKMRMQEERLAELERQIAELRENMARQRNAADRIVEERIRMMLRSEREPGPEHRSEDHPRDEAPGAREPKPR